MKNIIKNIQNTDIYDSQFLLERREDYDDEEEGCIENSEDEKEKIILSQIKPKYNESINAFSENII